MDCRIDPLTCTTDGEGSACADPRAYDRQLELLKLTRALAAQRRPAAAAAVAHKTQPSDSEL
jgi:hypothetical protein